jgi:hypothetical protein
MYSSAYVTVASAVLCIVGYIQLGVYDSSWCCAYVLWAMYSLAYVTVASAVLMYCGSCTARRM